MNFEPKKVSEALRYLNFDKLFIELLGWDNPKADTSTLPKQVQVNNITYSFNVKIAAEKVGAVIYLFTPLDSSLDILESSIQNKIVELYRKLGKAEAIYIFLDKATNPTISNWVWQKVEEGGKRIIRRHDYFKSQDPDFFIPKLSNLFFDISKQVNIGEVGIQMKKALDLEPVTKKYYNEYKVTFDIFSNYIVGIDDPEDKRWYASIILNRLMFIYFLQKKGFIDNSNTNYLSDKLVEFKKRNRDSFYKDFLHVLFFEGFAKPENQRSEEANIKLGKIKYLNGGLFMRHRLEDQDKYPALDIPDVAFDLLLSDDGPKGLFNRYRWALNEIPEYPENEINPNVLGHIFEKYINQKEFGAYYTKPEITEYLCRQTVEKLILDRVNERIDRRQNNTKKYLSFESFMARMTQDDVKDLVLGDDAILKNISLLDPACGSGAFLVSAMQVLMNIYQRVYGIERFRGNDSELDRYFTQIAADHPSVAYYIKKQIITHNLYGVDIMEEAVEIAKLRLFLNLVSSAQSVEELEPLPNIDFNIMAGNSLIGFTQIEESYMDDMFISSYTSLIKNKENLRDKYRSADLDPKELQELRELIDAEQIASRTKLNHLLMVKYSRLKIRKSVMSWDYNKNDVKVTSKDHLSIQDIASLNPFHWAYEFSEIFRNGGFDAVITNPPWQVLQADSKEFFSNKEIVSNVKKMNAKEWNGRLGEILKVPKNKQYWLDYCTSIALQSTCFKNITDYKIPNNEYTETIQKTRKPKYIDLVLGKKNLYSLFLVRCFQLLKSYGTCGIVVPSGIYTDEGGRNLRKYIFNNSKITGLFSFVNKKKRFFDIHASFKFVILSFQKSLKTESFPVHFNCTDESLLINFPNSDSLKLDTTFIQSYSPLNLSVVEVENNMELDIYKKVVNYPRLKVGDDNWGVHISSDFNMKSDSALFLTENLENTEKLFEGKMIQQFNNNFSEPNFWIKVTDSINNRLIRPLTGYRIIFRDTASATNERSAISTIIHNKYYSGNTAPYIFLSSGSSLSELVYLCAIFNSFVFDFLIRRSITSHLNFFFVENMPVPKVQDFNLIYKALCLICINEDYRELWESVTNEVWDLSLAVKDKQQYDLLRAELDCIVAKIYGLTYEEFKYILTTFPLVSEDQKSLVLTHYSQLL